MKSYVNFIEFEKNTEVKKAFSFLSNVLFPDIGPDQSKIKICSKLNWEEWEVAIIEGFKLKGKNRALFLGHSQRWASTDLIY